MNNETIEIKKKEVISLYRSVNKDGRYLLEVLFGEDLFKPKDVRERVKTFEDACRELGEEHLFVKAFRSIYTGTDSDIADVVAYHKLRIVCAALNEGWEPKFYKGETRYYPWFWLYTKEEIDEMSEDDRKELNMTSTYGYQTEYAGFACADSCSAPSNTNASIGSRLCLKSGTLAKYCGRQFTDIWADFLLIRK